MRYLNTKNLIAAGVLLACMSSIAWGAIIPDRTRIIMNESDKGEALKLTNQSKNLPYLAQTPLLATIHPPDFVSHIFVAFGVGFPLVT